MKLHASRCSLRAEALRRSRWRALQDGRGAGKNAAAAADLLWTAMTTGPVAERRNAATLVMRRVADWSTELRRDLTQRLWQAGVYTGASDAAFGEDVKLALDARRRCTTCGFGSVAAIVACVSNGWAHVNGKSRGRS